MGSSVTYEKKYDSGFYRSLFEIHNDGDMTVLTYHKDRPQGIFFFATVKEIETEYADVEEKELWLCNVKTDNTNYGRLVVKVPSSKIKYLEMLSQCRRVR